MKTVLRVIVLLAGLVGAAAAQGDFDLRARADGRWLLTRYLGPDSVLAFHDGPVWAFATSSWAADARAASASAQASLPAIAGALGVPVAALSPTWILISPGGRALAREAPEWSAGIAEPDRHLIVLSGPALRTGRAGLEATVAHELVHLALHARLGADGWVPRWFEEGLAMHLAGTLGWRDRISTWGRGPIELHDLTGEFPRDARQAQFAYIESEAAVRRLAGRGSIVPLLNRLQAGQDFSAAFEQSYGETLADFEGRVHGEVAEHWRWLTALGGGVSLGGIMAALAIAGALRVRRRNRRRLQQWAAYEQAVHPLADDALPWQELPTPQAGSTAPDPPPAAPAGDDQTHGPTRV